MTLPIKKHRKQLGLTQKALAAKLGVSVPSVVNWESGKIGPRGKNLAKVENFLGTKTSAPKKAEKKVTTKPKKKAGRPKGKAGKPKKAAPKKKAGRPKGKTIKPKGKVGRPKMATKAKAPKKRRGRPKSTAVKTSSVTAQLGGVAKELGFASIDEMVKTILRKHKIGKLDL